MSDENPSPMWKKHCRLLGIVAGLAIVAYCISSYKIDNEDVAQYYKVKESRRGKIRKAKEKKENIECTQERTGITRALWIDEESGPRRQFFLKATSALASASNLSKKTGIKEVYDKPKGWFQEELYWVISDTGEKVSPQNDTWVRNAPPHQKIPERLYNKIVPMQRVRFFDAASGEWDPISNKMIATSAFFSVLKVNGHDLPKTENEGELIARGTANRIIFSFDKAGRKQVACQGVKLHLNQGTAK